eukprot:1854743-Pleurochrysis_carterae.AAC.3
MLRVQTRQSFCAGGTECMGMCVCKCAERARASLPRRVRVFLRGSVFLNALVGACVSASMRMRLGFVACVRAHLGRSFAT